MISAERENTLLQRAKEGDEIALKLLIEAASDWINRRLNRRIPPWLRSVIDVDDVLVDATHIALRYLKVFQPLRPNAFSCFFAHRAFNRLRDLIRTHRNRESHRVSNCPPHQADERAEAFGDLLSSLPGSGKTPSGLAATSEASLRVRRAFETLSDQDRDVVWARYVDKFSIRETAALFGLSQGIIRSTCDSAIGKLRRILGKESKYWSSKS